MVGGLSRVSLVKGDDRYSNLIKALGLIEEDIQVTDARRIVIKPNLTSLTRQLASTHVDAIQAVLDFLGERTSAEFIIAEGVGDGSTGTCDGFGRFGYRHLTEKHNVRFVDLNADTGVAVDILDFRLKPFKVKVAQTMVSADYLVSICPPKTHDYVVFTGALKNVLVGSLLRPHSALQMKATGLANRIQLALPANPLVTRATCWPVKFGSNDKIKVHQGYPAMNLNLYKLARVVAPHLSVLDGFEAMEGDGPIDGDKVDLGIAIASTDFVSADTLAAKCLGFDVAQIGYLTYCYQGGLGEGNIARMDIRGESLEECARSFKPHHSFDHQLKWHVANPVRFL